MRLNDGRVVPNFIFQALAGKPLTVYGDGKQTRSFQYYSDLVEGVYRLLLSDETSPVNIGNPNEFSIKQLAEIIIELTGSKSKFEYKPLPFDDPVQRQPDISLAKEKLNWEPTTKLRDGLTKSIEYFESHVVRNTKDD